MSFLKILGIGVEEDSKAIEGTATVRKIVAELETMEPAKARYVAAFAYILGRVAHADLDISEVETRKMEEVIRRLGHLPEEQAILVVQIAKSQNRLFGHTENFLVTREFVQVSTPTQRQELLDCLFAVSAADDSITSAEEAQIRQIASELGFSHRQFVEARKIYSQHREVLKSLQSPSS